MSALQVYLVHKNRLRVIFGSPALRLESARDRQTLANEIDSELGSKNLTLNGQMSRETVKTLREHLNAAARELKALDPAVRMSEVA